jgi:hypothetical protein
MPPAPGPRSWCEEFYSVTEPSVPLRSVVPAERPDRVPNSGYALATARIPESPDATRFRANMMPTPTSAIAIAIT